MTYRFIDEGKKHLHTLDGKPLLGTSTVVGVLAKPLTWWASGMAVSLFGWLNPKLHPPESVKSRAREVFEQIRELDLDGYISLLKKAYGAHAEKMDISAEAGTDMHSLLEDYVKKMISDQDGVPRLMNDDNEGEENWKKVQLFARWAVENVEKFLYSEVHVYSEKMWTGGITDLVFVMKDGKTLIGDFKSSKEAYLSQFIQIAGYDLQQEENGILTNDGEKLSNPLKVDGYVVFPFGGKEFVPAFRYNTEELKEGFKSACVLYKLSNQ